MLLQRAGGALAQLQELLGVVLEEVERLGDLTGRLIPALPRLEQHQRRELRLARAHPLGDRPQERDALLVAAAVPRRERLPGALERRVDVGGGRHRDARQHPTGLGGVVGGEAALAREVAATGVPHNVLAEPRALACERCAQLGHHFGPLQIQRDRWHERLESEAHPQAAENRIFCAPSM